MTCWACKQNGSGKISAHNSSPFLLYDPSPSLSRFSGILLCLLTAPLLCHSLNFWSTLHPLPLHWCSAHMLWWCVQDYYWSQPVQIMRKFSSPPSVSSSLPIMSLGSSRQQYFSPSSLAAVCLCLCAPLSGSLSISYMPYSFNFTFLWR